MRISDALIMELQQEAKTTRRVLDRIPGNTLSWRPHKKSMSLGQLGLHVAQTPGFVVQIAKADLSALPPFQQAEAASTRDVLAALDASVADATAALNGWDDAKMLETWTLSNDGKTLMAIPRVGVIRTFLLNHWYHHRGQLVVYLRLLDVPVPSVYGPSADGNPFAGAS